MYYLQSRYYDPAVGRFISADSFATTDADGFLSSNMFAYCENNPVNLDDPDGTLPSWATKVIIGTAVIAAAAVLTVATGGTGLIGCFAVGALQGSAAGALVGAAQGAVSGLVAHRIATGSWKGSAEAALNGAADGYLAGAITGFITGGLTSNACFVAGTAVLASTGYVAIENIKAGDYVWAWDEETGGTALKQVVETYINETTELVHVYVNGEDIVTTPTHPFYSPVKGWTSAIHLKAGDILVLVNGEYVIVEQVQHELLEAPIKVYNFQVEGYHTYYVSNSGVLVHNSCNHGKEWARERRNYWRQTSKTAEVGKNYGSYTATEKNIARMASGKAPIGWDGYSVQLHHWKGISVDFYDYSPVSRTVHRIIHSLK